MPRFTKNYLDARCKQCLMQHAYCICDGIPAVKTQIEFIVVRHWKERNKPSNTARLAELAMPSLTVVDYGAAGTTWDPRTLLVPQPALLFPDTGGPTSYATPKTVIVVDGTWPQARKLVNKIPGLNGLPRLRIHPPATAPVRMRTPPIADGMSTIEAIAAALDTLEGAGTGDPLRELFHRAVEATISARGRPLHQ
jgi:DTW domain-containing protein YfiP